MEVRGDGGALFSLFFPRVADPRDVHARVQPQAEAELGGVVLHVADVVNVQLRARALAPMKPRPPGERIRRFTRDRFLRFYVACWR